MSKMQQLVWFKDVTKENIKLKQKKCILYSLKSILKKAYIFLDTAEIVVYPEEKENDGSTRDTAIDQENFCIKLNVKEDENKASYIHIDSVKRLPNCATNLNEIFRAIYEIAMYLKIYKFYLVDDSYYPCGNKLIQTFFLRSIEPGRSIDTISIYNKYRFTSRFPIKNIEKPINKLRTITCGMIRKEAVKVQSILKYKTTLAVFKLSVGEEENPVKLSISDQIIDSLEVSDIISSYRENMDSIIKIFPDDDRLIYNFYKEQQDCELQNAILDLLETPSNRYIIIINKEAIRITDLFNLFYTTFQKIKNIYSDMDCDLYNAKGVQSMIRKVK